MSGELLNNEDGAALLKQASWPWASHAVKILNPENQGATKKLAVRAQRTEMLCSLFLKETWKSLHLKTGVVSVFIWLSWNNDRKYGGCTQHKQL